MKLSLHVQSRGLGPDHDYRWLVVETGMENRQERPPRLDAKAAQLLQSEHPSVLIVRVGEELLVLLTALSTERSDHRGRKLRNSLALTIHESHEALIRGLGSLALHEEHRARLEKIIDRHVSDSSEHGFQVNAKLIEDLCELEANEPEQDAEAKRRLYPDSSEAREYLSKLLWTSALPEHQGPLVVATGAVSSDRLLESGAWRGISRLVQQEVDAPSLEVRSSAKKGVGIRRSQLAAVGLILLTILLILLTLKEKSGLGF